MNIGRAYVYHCTKGHPIIVMF